MADEKTLTVKLVRSAVTQVKRDQTRTCFAVGLRKIGDTSALPDNPSVRGMIFKVKNLVEVTAEWRNENVPPFNHYPDAGIHIVPARPSKGVAR